MCLKVEVDKALGWVEYVLNGTVKLIEVDIYRQNDENPRKERYLLPNVVVEEMIKELNAAAEGTGNETLKKWYRKTVEELVTGTVSDTAPDFVLDIIRKLGVKI